MGQPIPLNSCTADYTHGDTSSGMRTRMKSTMTRAEGSATHAGAKMRRQPSLWKEAE